MENKSKNLFLKFLPRAASAMSFQNPQFSPGRDHHHHHHSSSKLKAHAHKGFSGPLNFSVLPDEARGRPKKDGTFEAAHEPTSPKVSCMGQIKHKHKKIKKLRKLATTKNNRNNTTNNDALYTKNDVNNIPKSKQLNKKNITSSSSSSSISKFFKGKKSSSKGFSSEEHGKNSKVAALDHHHQQQGHHKKAPSLGQMNKFASGRESLANFDWTAQIAPLDHHDRDFYSDDEERRRDHSDDDDDDDDEVIIPFSAPIMLGGGGGRLRGDDHDHDHHHDMMGRLGLKPKEEVNLWKRRTMAPPPPLALNSKVRS